MSYVLKTMRVPASEEDKSALLHPTVLITTNHNDTLSNKESEYENDRLWEDQLDSRGAGLGFGLARP